MRYLVLGRPPLGPLLSWKDGGGCAQYEQRFTNWKLSITDARGTWFSYPDCDGILAPRRQVARKSLKSDELALERRAIRWRFGRAPARLHEKLRNQFLRTLNKSGSSTASWAHFDLALAHRVVWEYLDAATKLDLCKSWRAQGAEPRNRPSLVGNVIADVPESMAKIPLTHFAARRGSLPHGEITG